ncbi:MAG: hypothetical protein EOP53_01435 [Sphingobacteriales bacterium]|nr:MAG: hypothetical protein EOP53_01435 [Sphingobacteriales bacterium]
MKYSKWIGLAAAVALIIVCFMPWTYHADVQKNFTGFFSQNEAYGKPGKFLIIFSVMAAAFFLLPRIWAKRMNFFVTGIMLAYAIKTYILYTSCYNAYCPEKRLGIYLVVALAVLQFMMSLFPDMKINKNAQQ